MQQIVFGINGLMMKSEGTQLQTDSFILNRFTHCKADQSSLGMIGYHCMYIENGLKNREYVNPSILFALQTSLPIVTGNWNPKKSVKVLFTELRYLLVLVKV